MEFKGAYPVAWILIPGGSDEKALYARSALLSFIHVLVWDQNLAPDGYFHTVFTTREAVIIFNGRISVDFSICIELTFKLNHRLIFFSCLFKYIYRPLCSD